MTRYVVINQYGIVAGKSRVAGDVAYEPRDGSYERCAKWCNRNDTAHTCAIIEIQD